MTLTDKFIREVPRENCGANTSNAYDYQKDWSIWLLLDCHQSMDDYLIVFDYHDDVVVFDSATNANSADFYQIKSKQKPHWIFSDIIRKKKKGNSIIGKMYNNKKRFKCSVSTQSLISNAPFKFELDNGENGLTRDCICATQISTTLKTKLQKCLKTEHKVEDVSFQDILFFKVSEIGIRNHANEIIGHLAQFLETKFPNVKSKPVPLYHALFSEVSKKTDYGKTVSEYCSSLKHKSMSKQDFETHLSSIAVKRDFTELWKSIEPILLSESISPLETRNLRDQWDQLEIHLMDKTNVILQKVYQFVKASVSKFKSEAGSTKNISSLLISVRNAVESNYNHLPDNYNKEYLDCITLAAFYE